MATDRSNLRAIMDRMKMPANPMAPPPARIVPEASSIVRSEPVPASIGYERPAGFQGQTDRTTLRAFMDRIRP